MLRLTGVGHAYDGVEVLTGVDLELGEGRVGLIGVNGAGKSTLLRILTTATEPTSGTLAATSLGRTRREVVGNIGYMPQELRLPTSLRSVDFLAYVAWLKGIPRRERRAEIDRVVDQVGLADRSRSRVGQLSGGMQRRLFLAQALLGEPPVMVLDEPTAGLDPEQRIRFREVLLGLEARLVVVSSHTFEDLVPVVDRMVMLDERRVVFDGPVEALAELGARAPIEGMSVFEAAFLRLRLSRGGSVS